MLVQFGQVTLFSAVFPLAAVLALANNVVEIHSDSYKLLSLQRPHPQRTKTLGAWLHGFEACAFAAVASNVGLVYVAALQRGALPHLPNTTLLLLFVALEVSSRCGDVAAQSSPRSPMCTDTCLARNHLPVTTSRAAARPVALEDDVRAAHRRRDADGVGGNEG